MDAQPLPPAFLLLVLLPAFGTGLTHGIMMQYGSIYATLLERLNIRNDFSLAMLIYGLWASAGGLLLLWLLAGHGVEPEQVHLGDGGRSILVLIATGVATGVVCIALWQLIERVLRRLGRPMFRSSATDTSQWLRPSLPELLILGIVGAILVPVFEEIVFRGYLLAAMNELTGSAIAGMAITALAFGLIHFYYGAGVMAYAVATSLVFSALTLAFGTILPGVIAHAIINCWSFVVIPAMRGGRPL